MDSFDNFQYDSASSYGPLDDTSSVYTTGTLHTQDGDGDAASAVSVDLSQLSLEDYKGELGPVGGARHGLGAAGVGGKGVAGVGTVLDEDFDGVLDDLKEEGELDLPAHACR